MKKSFLLLFFIVLFSQCTTETDNLPTERAFYYWQTTLNFDEQSDSLANELQLKTIYLRYFDINWSEKYSNAIPVGVLDQGRLEYPAHFQNKNIIPTVFITNQTIRNLHGENLEGLATKTAEKIRLISLTLESSFVASLLNPEEHRDDFEAYKLAEDNARRAFKTKITEVQIDCDWTASTRDKFFKFLELLKPKLNDKLLSCTVRLHQYRDRELMGIPPVDRGLLMCYNVSEVQKMTTKNAILDAVVVKQYLKGKPYPIKLDIGLPMFSWAAWYRGTEFKGIVSGWNELDAKDASLYQKTSNNRYFIRLDTVIGDNYLRQGDMLRWDNGFENEMNKTIELLKESLDLAGVRISFFDWEIEKVKRHKNIINAYYQEFE